MQKQFRYTALVDGVPTGQLVDAMRVQQAHPELNVPVDSLTDAQLAEISMCRVVVPAFPIDGYRYDHGPIVQQDGAWVATWTQLPTPDRDRVMMERSRVVRNDRNSALSQCDWTQLADAPLNAEQRAAWGAHRQALRDLTAQPNFPWQVEWPVKPT